VVAQWLVTLPSNTEIKNQSSDKTHSLLWQRLSDPHRFSHMPSPNVHNNPSCKKKKNGKN
jgi:hypothetical protein